MLSICGIQREINRESKCFPGHITLLAVPGRVILLRHNNCWGSKMKTDQDKSESERRINSGILGLCVLFAVVITALVGAFSTNIGKHWWFFVVVFAVAFGLSSALHRIRPLQQNAGAGWSRFYAFILTQMDMGKAFKRERSRPQPPPGN